MIISVDNRMIFENDFEVLYIKSEFSTSTIELERGIYEGSNFNDFIENIIYNLELSDFEVYDGLCNVGLFGKLCEVENGYIKEME